jgi:hypothetical protein
MKGGLIKNLQWLMLMYNILIFYLWGVYFYAITVLGVKLEPPSNDNLDHVL